MFDFSLTYKVKNSQNREAWTEVALPPDTARQKVFYRLISPTPANVRIDEDGNWLARFNVQKGEILEVKAEGSVQIYADKHKQYDWKEPADWGIYLAPTAYWQSEDEKIKELARTLGTTEKIYDFVVKTLNYDYERIRQGAERLGGRLALEHPDAAICTEFADLFVSLARAAGIPAREVEGYAYTTNPQVQPLSLLSDVLHAWPEYWDNQKHEWVPVDPTWEKTTGGVDYFSNFGLDHFTFAIHGVDPTLPLPAGSYKQEGLTKKDVVVSFGKQPLPVRVELATSVKIAASGIFGRNFKIEANIQNKGGVAQYNLPIEVSVSGIVLNKNKGDSIKQIPPYGYVTEEVEGYLPWTLLLPPGKIAVVLKAGEQQVETYLPQRNYMFGFVLPYLLGLVLVAGGGWGGYLLKEKFFTKRDKIIT